MQLGTWQSVVLVDVNRDNPRRMVRLSLLRFLDVDDVVRHPIDRFRVLYYKSVEYEQQYDYINGNYTTPTGDRIDGFSPDIETINEGTFNAAPRIRRASSTLVRGRLFEVRLVRIESGGGG